MHDAIGAELLQGKSCISNVHAFDMILLRFNENCDLEALDDDMLWFGFVPPFSSFMLHVAALNMI